ncbi:MAG: SBBP repeat-containing protein [Thermoplasmata archaeon]|nr:MAG: SBBP repeat-containing protein [Thermoplasmata archaeon]
MVLKKAGVLIIILMFIVAGCSVMMFGTESEPAPWYEVPVDSGGKMSELENAPLQMPAGYFTENEGQVENQEVLYYLDSGNFQVGFTQSALYYKITAQGDSEDAIQEVLVKITFEGANDVRPVGENKLGHKSNFLNGNDVSEWRTGVANYREVVYPNLYNGIDLLYYTNENGLKYDFVVHPGADPGQITVVYEGIAGLELTLEGDMLIHTVIGELCENAPYTYELDGDEITCEFVLKGLNSYGFECGAWDHSQTLVIDPQLIYSTFIGGSDMDNCNTFALASDGSVYLAGWTSSVDFPTTPGAYMPDYIGISSDAWLARLSADWSTFLFVTYFGGTNDDSIIGINLDKNGNVYSTGATESSDFPTTADALQKTFAGDNEAFVSVFNPDGTTLLYSTYFGGSKLDWTYNVVFDKHWDYYIVGMTGSPDLPTTSGAFDPTFNGGEPVTPWGVVGLDGFLTKFDGKSHDMIYSTYIGGSRNDFASGVQIDSKGRAVVIGAAYSYDFPTTENAYDRTYNGDGISPYGYKIYGADIIVMQFNSAGSDILYSTYLGTSEFESVWELALDSSGDAYISSHATSPDFPTTAGAYDTTFNGGTIVGDGIWAKIDFDSSGSESLEISTYFGGSWEEGGGGICVDPEGYIYVSGRTSSTDFPTTPNAYDATKEGGMYQWDAYITKFDPSGSKLLYGTYYGGSNHDVAPQLKIDDEGYVNICGFSVSPDFPTTPGAADTTFNGGTWVGDGYMSKWDIPDAADMIDDLIEDVEDLEDANKLNKGQANSLLAKLRAAQKQIDKGHPKTAANIIGAFINEVNSMVKTKKLTSSDGQALIDKANLILSQM